MRSPADVQAEFAEALRDPAIAAPPGVVGPDTVPSQRRFAIYRNNVIVGLVNALASSFPAVQKIVGDEFFRAMARSYVLAEPPRSPVLMDYGETFAEFIDRFAPASGLPYLPDVARIERAWREAYHAADARPLGADAIAAVPPDELEGVIFAVHPSLRVVRSRYPALTIWRMNAARAEVVPVDMSVPEDTLIIRPDAEVEVRQLPPGGADLLSSLATGTTLGDSAAQALAADPRFNLAGNIAGLIEAGVLVEIRR